MTTDEARERIHQESHDFIQSFLDGTKSDLSNATIATKTTIAQFLEKFRDEIIVRTHPETYIVQRDDIFKCEIISLRNCIIHLEECLKFSQNGVTVQ